MNFDNKYGDEIEIKNMIVNDFHEYMLNYFINNPDKHNLNYIFVGISYGLSKYENDAVLNNRLFTYIIDNVHTEELNEHIFENDNNIYDFIIGLMLIIPFGAIFENDNDTFRLLNDEPIKNYIKIKELDNNTVLLKFKPEKLLTVLDEDIKFEFKQQ